jgi:hypothetical protein
MSLLTQNLSSKSCLALTNDTLLTQVQRNEDFFLLKTSDSLRTLLGIQNLLHFLTLLSETTILECIIFDKVDSFHYRGKGNRANVLSRFLKTTCQ